MAEGKAASTKRPLTGTHTRQKSGFKTGKPALAKRPAQPPIRCPECGSTRVWKDGLRSTKHGDVQRWLCRDCGFRFSFNASNEGNFKAIVKPNISSQARELHHSSSNPSRDNVVPFNLPFKEAVDSFPFPRRKGVGSHVQTTPATAILAKPLSILLRHNSPRRVSVSEREAKNLVGVETQQQQAAGATKQSKTDIESNIINFIWHLKKQGYPETTIKTYATSIRRLHDLGANVMDPDSIKLIIADHKDWKNSYKRVYVNAFHQWARMFHISWDAPRYIVDETLPWIPLEVEIDQLIAGCGKKTATFLQLVKETAMRYIEAFRLSGLT